MIIVGDLKKMVTYLKTLKKLMTKLKILKMQTAILEGLGRVTEG